MKRRESSQLLVFLIAIGAIGANFRNAEASGIIAVPQPPQWWQTYNHALNKSSRVPDAEPAVAEPSPLPSSSAVAGSVAPLVANTPQNSPQPAASATATPLPKGITISTKLTTAYINRQSSGPGVYSAETASYLARPPRIIS